MGRYWTEFKRSPVGFAKRVPPGLTRRVDERLVPLKRSNTRRELEGRVVRARRWVAHGGNGSGSRPLTLRFANAHGSLLPELHWFADAVVKVSNGDVRIDYINRWTTPDNTREETSTMASVMREQADLGWAGTRAFGVLGVRSLDPLQAPMLFDEYQSLGVVVAHELMHEMMEPLERLGLKGLVVLPGGLRKPFAFTRRLLAPRDYEGAKLRIHESLVAETTYRALDAEAVVLSVRQMASNPMQLCDGLDIQTEALAGWGLRGSITYNVNLWPRTLAIAASERSFTWLGEPERQLLLDASQRTLMRALDKLQRQDEIDRAAVPESVNPIEASADDVQAIRRRVEPAHEELRRHPDTAPFYERLRAIAERSRPIERPVLGV
jgi:TRAP-type C4-dicarboxylate transport system substrate-binding protein